ncbi:hypothetical protein KDL01_10170 [Actinospica durhamensis]|uniref:Uncharacterized protein n=1 Tax=Actinospica durhamensis TaxID=1508375 RepID=A0A941EM33_9ACTN|nr:hypothetical protein [Actinospica durhamensis]MBR7833631.1 hypothetical protein [Actinospica durhamensis]
MDCLDERGQVLFEPNGRGGGAYIDCWFLDSPSLAAWLKTWLTGTAGHSLDLGPHEVMYSQPCSHTAARLSGKLLHTTCGQPDQSVQKPHDRLDRL